MNEENDSYVIYKPYGVLSQFTPEGNRPALGSLFRFPKDCYPVGRLDAESEGLLIISNDASLNRKLLDPVNEHARTYFVQVDGEISEEAVAQLRSGVEIKVEGKSYRTKKSVAEKIAEPFLPASVPPVRFRKSIPTSWISLTLAEGKNRQVRHMTAAVGFPTLRLVRVKIENLELGNMQPGEVRKIKGSELKRLLKL
ncbi:MAG TPA: pseudouridine synthase [Bacteroidia bacterium]|nr:pseudouridine synthase [Bacteroidia bacterium]